MENYVMVRLTDLPRITTFQTLGDKLKKLIAFHPLSLCSPDSIDLFVCLFPRL